MHVPKRFYVRYVLRSSAEPRTGNLKIYMYIYERGGAQPSLKPFVPLKYSLPSCTRCSPFHSLNFDELTIFSHVDYSRGKRPQELREREENNSGPTWAPSSQGRHTFLLHHLRNLHIFKTTSSHISSVIPPHNPVSSCSCREKTSIRDTLFRSSISSRKRLVVDDAHHQRQQ
jgi:hypothetical protein